MKCRHCGSPLNLPLVDLGSAPPSNAYLTELAMHAPEKWFPLRVLVCDRCWLAQTEDFSQANELFDAEYAYFSGFSSSWLKHCEAYVAAMVQRFSLGAESHVVEVAANDGYLLQYVQARNIPCTGVEPTASTAVVARSKGISIIQEFFGVDLARKMVSSGIRADLTAANNVLAHVPDINDFVAGFAELLKADGVATFEFPHLMRLMENNQFDTIYHEHYSYLSLTAVLTIFEANGLTVFDVEEIPTHGGSLRVFAQRSDLGRRALEESVRNVVETERDCGMRTRDYYDGFNDNTNAVKDAFLTFLLDAKKDRKKVVAYGAAAKGNTLMNYAGVRSDMIQFVVDRNPAKQGKFMPGSRVPIVAEERIRESKPAYIVIFPWNLRDEVVEQLSYVKEWGARFVTVIPQLRIEP